jgi:hypothetical protein
MPIKFKVVPPVLESGDWVSIGHRSEIRLIRGELQHRLDGIIQTHPLSWLLEDKPLLAHSLHFVEAVA